MKKHTHLVASLLCVCALLLPLTSFAQGKMGKAQAIAQQLNLTPEQKAKILPILSDEVPKVEKIKSDNSLSRMQKMQAIKTIHNQTDPQMKAILTPDQYKKLQDIRHQALKDAIQTYR